MAFEEEGPEEVEGELVQVASFALNVGLRYTSPSGEHIFMAITSVAGENYIGFGKTDVDACIYALNKIY